MPVLDAGDHAIAIKAPQNKNKIPKLFKPVQTYINIMTGQSPVAIGCGAPLSRTAKKQTRGDKIETKSFEPHKAIQH